MSVRKIKWGNKSKSDIDISPIDINSPSNISSNSSLSPEPKCNIERKIQIFDKFEGIYTTDYDIISIHHSILYLFDQELNQLSELENNLSKLKLKITETTKPITKKNLLNELKNLENNIESIKNQNRRHEYMQSVEFLIPEYTELASERKVISFKIKKKMSDEELKTKKVLQNKRLYIIASYIDIAKNYIKINLIQETPKKNECIQCKFDFNLFDEDIDFCPQCGLEHKVILKIPTYCENQGSKATDEKNFIKEIKRFRECKIPKYLKS